MGAAADLFTEYQQTNTRKKNMKTIQLMRKLSVCALALLVSSLAASACIVNVRVACPNDTACAGVEVCIDGVGCGITDSLGIAEISVPSPGTYTICVNTETLPPGATLKRSCQKVDLNFNYDAPPCVNFTLGGDYCKTPPPPGPCWLTGGGTIGKTKGVANYSFGGVVYPGCSDKAADGGNWNVVDHFANLHFQGKHIIVDECSGVSTKSPKVNVNIIDFHGDPGDGTIGGIGGNPALTVPVSFVGRAVDNLEPGGGSDLLYLKVMVGGTTVMQIGNSVDDPATISTGNLQIHTTSCAN